MRARGSHHARVPFQLVAIGEDRPARRDVEQLRRQYPHEVARLRHGARDDPLRAELPGDRHGTRVVARIPIRLGRGHGLRHSGRVDERDVIRSEQRRDELPRRGLRDRRIAGLGHGGVLAVEPQVEHGDRRTGAGRLRRQATGEEDRQ